MSQPEPSVSSESVSPVIAAVREARTHHNPNDVIDGVKKAIADELRRLDESVKIEKTEYFNHTFVPDLIATWREDGKRRERRIFIRGSLRSVVAANDAALLADQEPVLLGIGDEPAGPTWSKLRTQIPLKSKALATEISATSQITGARDSSRESAQLSGLVRANLVRGGRGVLEDNDARRIMDVETQAPAEALKAFNKTVKKLFVGETAARLTRTAGLLQSFFEANPAPEVFEGLRVEPLSNSELQVVLPYVLRRAADVHSEYVWDVLASMLTLERIESMSTALADVDMTPVIRRAVLELMAGRSALFFNAKEIAPEQMDAEAPKWSVRNGRLAADVHRWTIWLGSDARKLRGRDDGPDARWDELSAPLREFDMTEIELRGLSRHLSVANTEGDTVRQDVEQIRGTIQDDFHVASVTVREQAQEDAPNVKVEFAASTATGKAPVDFHVRAASLLSVKRPIAQNDLDLLLERS